MPTCREEYKRIYHQQDGTAVTMIVRTTIIPEDPYLNLAKAKIMSIRTGEDMIPDRISRDIRDHLIKVNITI